MHIWELLLFCSVRSGQHDNHAAVYLSCLVCSDHWLALRKPWTRNSDTLLQCPVQVSLLKKKPGQTVFLPLVTSLETSDYPEGWIHTLLFSSSSHPSSAHLVSLLNSLTLSFRTGAANISKGSRHWGRTEVSALREREGAAFLRRKCWQTPPFLCWALSVPSLHVQVGFVSESPSPSLSFIFSFIFEGQLCWVNYS